MSFEAITEDELKKFKKNLLNLKVKLFKVLLWLRVFRLFQSINLLKP